MGRGIFRIFVLLLLLRLSAFASDTPNIFIDVPFVQQQKDGCGAAVIAMVMQYWQQHDGHAAGPASDAAHIYDALYSPAAHGVYSTGMLRYFQQNGYRAFAFAGDRSDIERHLAKGRPLIVALNPGAHLPLHYVVVAGLEPDQHVVLVNDPAQRKLLKQDDVQFDQQWKAAGHWTLLAVPEAGAR
jgi:ABC-type bacteriocin/lantibiotic exporter with double-glycine peptidase domain